MADGTPRGLGRGGQAKTKNVFAQGDSCCAGEPVIKFTSLRIFSKKLVVFFFPAV